MAWGPRANQGLPSQHPSQNHVLHSVLVLGRRLFGHVSPLHEVGLQLRCGSEPRKSSFPLDQNTLHRQKLGCRSPPGAFSWGCFLLWQLPHANSAGGRPAGQTNTGAAGLTSVPPHQQGA